MKNKPVYTLWGVMYSLCAGLGFIPEPEGALRWILTVLSMLCFVPPVWLLWKGNEADRKQVRKIAGLSLLATLVTLVGNFLSVFGPQWLGTALYGVLVVVSSPMVASGYWAASLFLWACLFVAAKR